MNATRKTLGLAKVFAVFISLLFACTLLMSSVCAQPAFAGTTDETLLGTMTIQLDTSEPDNPNPNPNPDDNGNGDNGDGSGSNANNGDRNNGNLADGALKASAYNGKNGKGSLSNTGDVVSAVLIALFALSAVFLGCVYLSRRRAMSASGVDSTFKTTNISKLRTAFVAMLAVALIAGGVMSALKAFADGDVTDSVSSNTVDATSTVIVDKDGNIKSTSITLQNKLKTPVTVKSISAPTELSSWTSTIDANTEIAAEGETSGTWNTGDGKIPVSILKQLSEDNPSIELSFESEVSYTSYEIIYDASGGTDAIMTGAFAQSDGGGTTKTDDHKLRADETIGGAGGSAKNFQPVPNDTNNEGYVFVGWYTEPNGGGEEAVVGTTKVTKDTTFYACYLGTTFMAPASQSTANARKITGGRKYTLSYAKTAATAFAGSDTTSTLYNQFNDWMTNDSYHLYTLLKGADGNFLDPALTDSWIEFRIVHIGEKDTSDGTGLTFQAIHSLPVGYQMNSTSTIEGGWDSSELKRKMNAGEIFDSFDPRLTSITVPLSRGKLWIASYSEVTGNDQYNVKDGEQFLFLKNKVQLYGGGNLIVDLGKTRSGYRVHMYGAWWLRTTSPDDSRKAFHTVTGGGYIADAGGSYPVITFVGVVPCFSL